MSILQLVLLASVSACVRACYWNRECPFLLHSTKTPYDTVRGDIRDFDIPENCEAVSIWNLNRHGNRYFEEWALEEVKDVATLKDEIVASHEAGRGQLCAQDLENFRNWSWNVSLESYLSNITGTGYREVFDIAKRIRERYPHLVQGTEEDYYFRSFKEHVAVTASARAFVHGLTNGTNLTLAVDEVTTEDDITVGGLTCERYIQKVKNSPRYQHQVQDYYGSADFKSMHNAVQQRLGISIYLTPNQIYILYEICRFERSWSMAKQSPWCAAFSNQDLEVLEYCEDIKHFYKKGYGSWVNVKLGGPALRNLYETFEAVVMGQGRKVTSFFAHLTMLESVWCAMGIFKDPGPLDATHRNDSRLYRTSRIGAFGQNMIVVLNRCQESGSRTHRVQFFINEKVTELCPLNGCTWQQFQDKFQPFKSANLDFCNLDYIVPDNILNLTNAWF